MEPSFSNILITFLTLRKPHCKICIDLQIHISRLIVSDQTMKNVRPYIFLSTFNEQDIDKKKFDIYLKRRLKFKNIAK